MSDAPAPSWPAGILALIPVFNHAATVGAVAAGLRAHGATVLVVDDGSTDGSGEAARSAGAEVLTLPRNQGKAQAMLAGMRLAHERGYAAALTCDADGQHPVDEARRLALAAATDLASVHVGRRDMRGAPWISRFGRAQSNFWSWVACGRWLGDTQSGLRVYPLPTTLRLPVRSTRYAFEIEVLIRATWAKIAVHPLEVAVIYPENRISHFNKLADNLRAFRVVSGLILARLAPWRLRMLADA